MSQAAPRKSVGQFDPAPHEQELVSIIDTIARTPELDSSELDRILKRYPREGRGLFSRSEVIAGFRRFGAGARPELDEVERMDFILAAYKAGPGNVRKWRRQAPARGLDPNRWQIGRAHV